MIIYTFESVVLVRYGRLKQTREGPRAREQDRNMAAYEAVLNWDGKHKIVAYAHYITEKR
jgi:hypothetical protein